MGSVSASLQHHLTNGCWLTEVSACTHAAPGYVGQARAQSGPAQDVPCGVDVAIDAQPAARASGTTGGAILTRISRIHLDQPRTGSFSLVREHRGETRPRSIVDILGKRATSKSPDSKRFNHDHIVAADQPRARLMQVVGTKTCRCRMATPHLDPRFPPAAGAAHLPRERFERAMLALGGDEPISVRKYHHCDRFCARRPENTGRQAHRASQGPICLAGVQRQQRGG